MSDIVISTNGTIEGTKLSVDGKDLTKKHKVVSIDMYASAPFKGKYSGETYQGGVGVSFTHVDDEGKMKRETYGKSDTNYTNGVGQKMKSEDQVIRYLSQSADTSVSELADKIIAHCEKEKISCPDKDTLLARTEDSLKDKASDLGIKLDEEV